MTEEAEAPTTEPSATEEGAERPLSLLAKERFGNQFHGEVKEEQPEEAAETQDQPEGDTEHPDEEEKPDDASQEESESTPDDEDEGDTISSFAELVSSQEWDPEWANNLEIDVKVDGTPAKATIADLVKNYQIGSAAEKRLEDAKAKAKSITEEAAEKSKALEGQFATVAKLIEGAEAFINQDVEAIDWSKLREEDPAEYAAKKQEVADRRASLEKIKQGATDAWKENSEQMAAERSQQIQERLQEEQSKLIEKLPEWKDEEKAQTDKTQLADYLISQGFTKQDIANAYDHRLIVLAHKARLYDQGKAKVETAKKKVAKVPKVLKPGAPKSDQQINQDKVQQAKSKLQKSGSIDDAYAVLMASKGK